MGGAALQGRTTFAAGRTDCPVRICIAVKVALEMPDPGVANNSGGSQEAISKDARDKALTCKSTAHETAKTDWSRASLMYH